MAFQRLFTPSYMLLIFLSLLLFFVSTSALRLSQFDELDTENSISNQRFLQKRGTEEQATTAPEITAPRKKKPQVIRLGIKHEEHSPSRFPLFYDEESEDSMQPIHKERIQEEEEEDQIHLEARAAYYDIDSETSDYSIRYTCIGCKDDSEDTLMQPMMSYNQEPSSHHNVVLTRRQKLDHLSKRAPSDVSETLAARPCSCFTSDETSGVCFCNRKDNGIHKCPTILHQEHGIENHEARLHRRNMVRQGSYSPGNRKRGFLYSRNAGPLPKKTGKGRGRGNNSGIPKTGKCKGKSCKKQEKEAQSKGKKGKSGHTRRDAYMYHGQYRGLEMEL